MCRYNQFCVVLTPYPYRTICRRWARAAEQCIGDLTSPREGPDGSRTVVARCYRCEQCEYWYRLTGLWQGDVYTLNVSTSGEHAERARRRKATTLGRETCQPTAEDIRKFDAVCDGLLERNQVITAAKVAILLGQNRIAAPQLRELVRRRKRLGGSTAMLAASSQCFQAFVQETNGAGASLRFVNVVAEQNQFSWMAVCTPFWELLEALQPVKWALTADFTHSLALQGYMVAFVSALVHRRLGGRCRRTAWPLVVVLRHREKTAAYREAFQVVLEECRRRQLESPSQLHVDYFGGQSGAEGGVGKAFKAVLQGKVVNGLEHMTRNLQRNQRQGQLSIWLRVLVFLFWRGVRAVERRRGRLARRAPPHLRGRDMGYVLSVLRTLLFASTEFIFSLLMGAFLERLEAGRRTNRQAGDEVLRSPAPVTLKSAFMSCDARGHPQRGHLDAVLSHAVPLVPAGG